MAQNVTIDTSAYADGAILTEAKLDTVFGNTETVIEGILNGTQAFDSVLANATAEAVTISAGVATITRMYATLDAQTGSADDLDTITLTNGKFAFLRAASGDTITLKHGTGNITTVGAADVAITGNKTVLVFAAGSQVGVIGDAGSGGAGMTSFSLAGTSGTPQTISDGNTLTVAAGVGISTTAGATDTVTVAANVNGLTADASPDGAADYVMTYDASASTHKKVLLNNLPSSGGNSYAILRDEKATGTAGGSASATTWNNRALNTEVSDADNIVSISSNQFTPISGTYILRAQAKAYIVNLNRLRLYNVTGAASVEEGLNSMSQVSTVMATALLTCRFTANGTDAYRIDHYTSGARATDGLGAAVSDGTNEVYLEIELEKIA
jgi:hypothetical protein